ncbi:hypothetical protein [Paenibacillus beijingensis]|uniref:Uncharacterized protein n=1 Tax=Paenibacillus beijingensis TaxID=1126833 RepID=A0A0D5NFA3_9BACL|nr:hypothetical protein [Paenibacillus beijingensis]AJY73931.1 hypothetical protein VN24_04035 [Paenibacillus beijingensis]
MFDWLAAMVPLRVGNFAIAGEDDFNHAPIMQAIAYHDSGAMMTIDTHYPSFYQQDKVGEVEAVRRTKNYFESLVLEDVSFDKS